MQKYIYLGLAIMGVVLPYTQFVPWSNEHGFNIGHMVSDMFANKIAAGIALDALAVAVVIVVFIILDGRKHKIPYYWAPIAGIFISGIALALPLYLYLRERHLEIIKKKNM